MTRPPLDISMHPQPFPTIRPRGDMCKESRGEGQTKGACRGCAETKGHPAMARQREERRDKHEWGKNPNEDLSRYEVGVDNDR